DCGGQRRILGGGLEDRVAVLGHVIAERLGGVGLGLVLLVAAIGRLERLDELGALLVGQRTGAQEEGIELLVELVGLLLRVGVGFLQALQALRAGERQRLGASVLRGGQDQVVGTSDRASVGL